MLPTINLVSFFKGTQRGNKWGKCVRAVRGVCACRFNKACRYIKDDSDPECFVVYWANHQETSVLREDVWLIPVRAIFPSLTIKSCFALLNTQPQIYVLKLITKTKSTTTILWITYMPWDWDLSIFVTFISSFLVSGYGCSHTNSSLTNFK